MPTKPLSSVNSELEGHGRRVAALSKKLVAGLGDPPEQVLELCDAFDAAVEFAALEGMSVAEAIGDFVEEGVFAGSNALARLDGLRPRGVDIAAMSLPVMPKQVSRLLRTSNEDTSPAELEDIAACDPVMAGKLIGAANSALVASHFEITGLLEAAMRLGVPEARRVLLAACFAGLFASKPLKDLWKHSQAVAETASELAPLAGLEAETAYLAGLLHDIGRLGFLKLPPKARIREMEWLAAGFPPVYAETLAYGMDHAEAGAQLLLAWDLPEKIVKAVRFHHRPECSGSYFGAILTLAEDLTARAQNVGSEDLWPAMRRTTACLETGIALDQLEEFRLDRLSLKQACA
jgi:putative nucleotidyltransferase with HDIG domain